MQPSDAERFKALMTDAMAFYRKDVSKFALSVWWSACERFDLEQVSKALTAHAMDPDRGHFAPMPADIVKHLAGTKTDRALVAWGKVMGAIRDYGAYSSVAFDDAVIHAVLEDMGGWTRLCAGTIDELPFEQRRFCETYRTYSARPDVPHRAVLPGIHAQNNAKLEYHAKPQLIGDPIKAAAIASGTDQSRGMAHIGASLKQIEAA
jgi:hypothetical protein